MQLDIACYLLATFLFSWLALSTYHKWLNPIFNKPKTDMFWFNWLAHGLWIGLAFLPMALMGVSMTAIYLRAAILGLGMMMWSDSEDNVVWEECGRGALIVLTLPILLV